MAKGWVRRSMTIGCIAAVAFTAGGVAYGQAAAAPAAPAVQEATLKIGDKAPALTVETWIKGDAVNTFEPNKTYVIEFWATWCGPCINAMPHLSELQQQYKSKGLTVIGMSSKDTRGNTFEKAKAMVAEKGDTMGYTVAWDKERTTNEAFMKAAKRGGIPCSFVIDGKGNVAWIGHPMFLDIVLDKVVAGTWDYKAGPASVEKAEGLRRDVLTKARTDPKAALEGFVTMEKEYPAMAATMSDMHFDLLIRAGEYEKGYKIAGKVVDSAIAKKDSAKLNLIAWNIVDPKGNVENKNLDLAMKAAVKASEFTGDKDPAILDTLARVHFLKGDTAKAIELQKKAVELAEEGMKAELQAALDEYKAKGEKHD